MAKKIKKEQVGLDALNNSLTGFAQQVINGNNVNQVSKLDTIEANLRGYVISNNRNLLSSLYAEVGVVQTLIDQPVDDSFRSGFEIKTAQLSPKDIELLQEYLTNNEVMQSLSQSAKWGRLFGGGSVLLIMDEDPQAPLDIRKINKKTKIEYRATDLWELYTSTSLLNREVRIDGDGESLEKERMDSQQGFFMYYGHKIDPSRVLRIKGKEAPSLIKPTLRGWGMSEIEKTVRAINQYLKNQSTVFELLDEAKIDVYKINGFNQSLVSAEASNRLYQRVTYANMIKNSLNALTMDMGDDYQQKQINFSGFDGIMTQFRQTLAADTKFPMTKLFGISSAGFNSGEDDIENYNSMIEGEVRFKIRPHMITLIKIACQHLFEMIPDDIDIEFKSLRILGAEQEENVKSQQLNRIMAALSAGLMSPSEAKQAINKANLLPVDLLDTGDDLFKRPEFEIGIDAEQIAKG